MAKGGHNMYVLLEGQVELKSHVCKLHCTARAGPFHLSGLFLGSLSLRFNGPHLLPELGARVACDLCGDVTRTPGAAGALLAQALRVGAGEALLLPPTGNSLIRSR